MSIKKIHKKDIADKLQSLIGHADVKTQSKSGSILPNLKIRHKASSSPTLSLRPQLRYLKVTLLKPRASQPRRSFDAERLSELTEAIRQQGVLQPILVCTAGDGHYEIIAGERRWRAAQSAGLTEVPVIVKEVSPQALMAISLIENIQREDLTAIEQAEAIKQLIDEHDLTHENVAQLLGKSRSAVSNLLRLLDLDPSVQTSLREKKIEAGHAKVLASMDKPKQKEVVQVIVREKLSVRETEKQVSKLHESPSPVSEMKSKDWKSRLEQALPAKIDVSTNNEGKSKVTITFDSVEAAEKFVVMCERSTNENIR